MYLHFWRLVLPVSTLLEASAPCFNNVRGYFPVSTMFKSIAPCIYTVGG